MKGIDKVHDRDQHETCSFCGKSRREVDKLVAGAEACICNECVPLVVMHMLLRPEGVAHMLGEKRPP